MSAAANFVELADCFRSIFCSEAADGASQGLRGPGQGWGIVLSNCVANCGHAGGGIWKVGADELLRELLVAAHAREQDGRVESGRPGSSGFFGASRFLGRFYLARVE